MSILYKIDAEMKKQYPDLKSTIDSKTVQQLIESIIGEGTKIEFIKGYLKDKGYLYIDILDEQNSSVVIFDQEPELEPYVDKFADMAVEQDEDDFDLDAFLASDDFEKEMKKAEKIVDFTNNRELFSRLSNEWDEEIKSSIVVANIPLVNKIAGQYQHAINGSLDYDDLVNEGIIGLMKAVDRYNIDLGYEFSTYAYHWVRQAISRAIADKALTIRLPVHIHETLNKINNVEREYWKRSGQIDNKEIAEICEMSVEKYQEFKMYEYRFRHSTSLNTPLKEGGQEDILMMLNRESSIWLEDEIDSTDPVQAAEKIALCEEIMILFNHLTNREKQVLKMRFGFEDNKEKTLEEVGMILGVTRERIRQIQAKAMRKLVQPSIRMKLEEFIGK